MFRMQTFLESIDTSIKSLRTEGEFRRNFLKIVELAQSPFVQMIMDNYKVNPKIINTIFEALLNDEQVSGIAESAANIVKCFSVDRYVGVDTELELEQMAMKLNEKKLFFGGVYFKNKGYDHDKEFAYTLRVDIDNTPVTLESRNRFWFPGPNGNFELEMRYHRGFIEIQHMLDQAIIKTVTDAENLIRKDAFALSSTTTTAPTTIADKLPINTEPTVNTEPTTVKKADVDSNFSNETKENDDRPSATTEENVSMQLETTTTPTESTSEALETSTPSIGDDSIVSKQVALQSTILSRKRRMDYEALLNGSDDYDDDEDETGYPGQIFFGKMTAYTKQFPYPKYRKDNFKKGLYLAQVIQLTFFFALIVHVTSAVRNRIWLKESGNSTVSGQLFPSISFEFDLNVI